MIKRFFHYPKAAHPSAARNIAKPNRKIRLVEAQRSILKGGYIAVGAPGKVRRIKWDGVSRNLRRSAAGDERARPIPSHRH
jgi:hypothetical protein